MTSDHILAAIIFIVAAIVMIAFIKAMASEQTPKRSGKPMQMSAKFGAEPKSESSLTVVAGILVHKEMGLDFRLPVEFNGKEVCLCLHQVLIAKLQALYEMTATIKIQDELITLHEKEIEELEKEQQRLLTANRTNIQNLEQAQKTIDSLSQKLVDASNATTAKIAKDEH